MTGLEDNRTQAVGTLSAAWRQTLPACLLLLALILYLHRDAVVSMVTVWANSRTYNHGFLILPIVANLLWQRRAALLQETPRPSLLGLVWLLLAAALALLGDLAQANTVEHVALVLLIQGSVVAVFGLRVAWRLAFPLFYLFFMVPFGDFAIAPMQDLTARATTALVRASGVPIYLENWVMVIPGGAFLVAEACSGVRFLVATIALGILMSNLFFSRPWKRGLFLLLSVLVPIAANVVRTYGIVMLAYVSDFTIAVGIDHVVYGFIFLSIVLFVLIGIAYAMRDPAGDFAAPRGRPEGEGEDPPLGRRLLLMGLAAAAVLFAVDGYGARFERPVEVGALTLESPAAGDGWELLGVDLPGWRGRFPGADAQATWSFTKDGRILRAFVAYYVVEYPGKELISHRNSLLGSDRLQALRTGRLPDWPLKSLPPPAFLVLRGLDGARVVWYWYWVDGRPTADARTAKLLALRAKLLGRRPTAAIVAIAGDGPPEETAPVVDFLAQSTLGAALAGGGVGALVADAHRN